LPDSSDRRLLPRTRARAAAVSERGRHWAETREADSATGVAIGAWHRFRAVDGPLESALLSLYILIAVIPALLVMEEYLEPDAQAFATHMVDHYNLSAQTASLVRSVLAQDADHHLGSALFAIAGALFFGLNFGRVLQLVHARSWRIDLPARSSDYARYGVVLVGVYGLLVLLMVQLAELTGGDSWARMALIPGWIALLTAFFLEAPRLLTHGLISRRALLPGAVLTALGLVALMLVSSWVMKYWVDLYARDYGGLGVVMAVFFWLGLSSVIIVWSAALAPALADRRELRRLPDSPA